MKNDQIELISMIYTKDSIGQQIKTPSYSQVWAEKKGIPQNEFFLGKQNGIKTAYKFIIHRDEYNNETELRSENTHYHIYRVYPIGDDVELYCEVVASTR